MKTKTEHLELIPSSGNVFADMGFKDAETRLAKDIIDEHGWSQKEAGELLGINQPKVSRCCKAGLTEFQ
jgi:predicted XRE-type DNA-binding protein